jgi:hypothetical protein
VRTATIRLDRFPKGVRTATLPLDGEIVFGITDWLADVYPQWKERPGSYVPHTSTFEYVVAAAAG